MSCYDLFCSCLFVSSFVFETRSWLAWNFTLRQADLQLGEVLLPLPPECWGYKQAPQFPLYDSVLFFNKKDGKREEYSD